MSDSRDLKRTLVRSVSSVRRNGWNEATAAEALRALDALVPPEGEAVSRAEALARELLQTLIEQPGIAQNLGRRRDSPWVPRHLELVVELLAGPRDTLARLRDAFGDPTDQLVAVVNDLDDWERNEEWLPSPHAAAILALGQLETRPAMRCLFDCIGWPSENAQEVACRALQATTHLVEHAVALWSTMNAYARWSVAEELARRGERDDQVFALLVDWLDSGEDLEEAVCALGGYGDPRCVPHLLEAIDRLLDRCQPSIATEAIAYLADYGGAPTQQQRERHALLLREGDLN